MQGTVNTFIVELTLKNSINLEFPRSYILLHFPQIPEDKLPLAIGTDIKCDPQNIGSNSINTQKAIRCTKWSHESFRSPFS